MTVFSRIRFGSLLIAGLIFGMVMMLDIAPVQAAMTEYPKVRLRSLDKITARTMTFDARVGTTIKFGSIYIKIQSCQKPDLQDMPEAAAFLQIWEITPDDQSKWIFSGWMFASSPALSAMDHPIYDVWVIDCLTTEGRSVQQNGPAATPDTSKDAKSDAATPAATTDPAAKPEAAPDAPVETPPNTATKHAADQTPATDTPTDPDNTDDADIDDAPAEDSGQTAPLSSPAR